jgi:hypothetical protein
MARKSDRDAAKGQEIVDRPILELRLVGDGRVFLRALASILVRRELIEAGVIPDPERCKAVPTGDNEHVGLVEGIANDDSHVLPQVKE